MLCKRVLSYTSVTVLLLGSMSIGGQVQRTPSPIAGNLAYVLLKIVEAYHVSVLGELVQPIPKQVILKSSDLTSAQSALRALALQCPDYIVLNRNNVFLFINSQILVDPTNPMNTVLHHVNMPQDLSWLKVTLPNLILGARQGVAGPGTVISGIGLPPALSPKLKPETFPVVTARDLLVKAARSVGNLYSAVILKTPHPKYTNPSQNVLFDWDLAGGPGIDTYVLTSQSPN